MAPTENHLSVVHAGERTGVEEETCMLAMQLASLSVLPMTLKSAIELGVLEVIARRCSSDVVDLSPTEIASDLSIANPNAPVMLDRILRLLASFDILTCTLATDGDGSTTRRYGPTPVCRYLTPDEDSVSLAPFALMCQDRIFMESYYSLKDAVLDGGVPFRKAHGMLPYDYMGKDARFKEVFNASMSDHSTITMKQILRSYTGFEGLGSLVDVGGGIGTTLSMIASKYPGIKGVNFDLPHIIAVAPSLPGVEHVSGNMFESVPNADAIFMKWILHTWSDDECVKLLKNCWNAIPTHGKVIIVEGIIPAVPESNHAAKTMFLTDVHMLAHYPLGMVRAEKEFESLAKKAGFTGFKIACCTTGIYVMEATK